MRQRIRKLEEKCEKLNSERMPVQELLEEIRQAMQMEMLKRPAEDYLGWLADSKAIISKEKKKAQLLEQMQKLKDESVLCMGRQEERSAGGTGCEERIRIKVQEAIWGEQERNRTSECRSSRIGRTDEGREEKK